MGQLDGKVAVITGASRGIGRFMALEFAKEGADVVVAARSEVQPHEKLPGTIYTTADEVRALGRRALPVKLDLSDDDDIEHAVEATIAEFGRVDILVNNAGILFPGRLVDMVMKRIDLTWRVNVRGALLLTKLFLPHMIRAKSGTVIFISSSSADELAPGDMSYALSKAALRTLAEGWAKEVADDNIAMFSLSPRAWVVTPGVTFWNDPADLPQDQIEPDEWMGWAGIWLASDAAKQYTGRHFFSDEVVKEHARRVG
jgi:citronellol/citronellal dehydrogenase